MLRACLFIAIAGLLTGCLNSTDHANADAPPTFSDEDLTLTISGQATFERIPTTTNRGLDHSASTTAPIRGALVELYTSDLRSLISSTTCDAAGTFHLRAPANHSVTVVIAASLGDTAVVGDGNQTWALAKSDATGDSNPPPVAMHAASGWTGSGYDNSRRAAGPFAILDVVYRAQAMVRSADPTVTFPPLTIRWSPNEDDGTWYSNGRIVANGLDGVDTDEFDAHVIAHEWGHYYEDTFSRSDSIGGPHGIGDALDESVAFGEGFGNAIAGMIMGDPLYADTFAHGVTGVTFNLDGNTIDDSLRFSDGRRLDGGWSETSIMEVLYDCFDSDSGDDDTIALGFTPIHQVMTRDQPVISGLTNVYAFLDALKARAPYAASTIASRAAAENITTHDAYDELDPNRRRHQDLTLAVPASDATSNPYEPSWPPVPNHLLNRQFYRFTAPTTGTYTIIADPDNAAGDLAIYSGRYGNADNYWAGPERLTLTLSGGQTIGFAIGSFEQSESYTVTVSDGNGLSAPTADG
ncbi:MAG: hypothetical protein ACYTF0_03805 [Planctomycetota bacterium]